jgi:hypothetical protein
MITNLPGFKGRDHALLRHPANPFVRFDHN